MHTRETRAFASETKFVVDGPLGEKIRQWARTHLNADPHGTGEFGDEYHTTSLYFDTIKFDVFHRRGSYGRAKYRVRRYGQADVIFLERKLRQPGILVKRRTISTLDLLPRLEAGETGLDWPGDWFHQRLLLRKLRPVCRVSYHRTARAMMTSEGPARLTLDDALCAAPTDVAHFAADPGTPIFDGRLILELKYLALLPAVFKRLVEEFGLQAQTASKYRLSMCALGHVPAADAPAAFRESGASRA